MNTLLIVGCGTLGTALAERRVLAQDRVLCFTRRARKLPDGAVSLLGDVRDPRCFDGVTEPIDQVMYAVGPASRDEQAYRDVFETGLSHLLDWLGSTGRGQARLLLVSSTAVYAQSDGQWVDERSATEPTLATAKLLLEAEHRVQARFSNSVILRLAGIYGPTRQSLLDRAIAGLPPRLAGGHVVNRMHLSDCARAAEHLLSLEAPARLYLGADDEPASQQTVLDWLASRFELPTSLQQPASIEPGPGHKRCRNTRLIDSGFCLEYPTFRDGYHALALGAGLRPRQP